jgi:ribosomal protein L37AE/L43A
MSLQRVGLRLCPMLDHPRLLQGALIRHFIYKTFSNDLQHYLCKLCAETNVFRKMLCQSVGPRYGNRLKRMVAASLVQCFIIVG